MAKAYVTEYGQYGAGEDLLIFEANNLTEQQWDTLSELYDTDRIEYVRAILANKNLSKWEEA